jgi:magnesium-transporting ATPase (P-type)
MAPKGIDKFIGLNRALPFLQGFMVCDTPNSELYEFRGTLNLPDGTKYGDEVIALTENQLLLKGSILRNTEWVVGIVVYSGTDTKLMQNQGKSRFKQSRIELENNNTVALMLMFLIVSCFLLSGCALLWNVSYSRDASYLSQDVNGIGSSGSGLVFFGSTFLTTVCLNSTFIPISLLVAIEFVKIVQSW